MKLVTTNLLREAGSGNRVVVDQLFAILYEDLRARAQALFRTESPGHTLQPTALVNEAYLRLIDQRQVNWRDRAHFCSVAALAMRRILVDHARKKNAVRRTAQPAARALTTESAEDVLFVHELIEELREKDENQARIVELRFFADLTVAEVAEVLGVSKRTVEAEWTMIRALIRARLESPSAV